MNTTEAPPSALSCDEALEAAARLMRQTLRSAPAVVREYTAHLTLSQGKYIRARMVLACAMDENGRVAEEAVRFASAVELLHLASLVHDDVIDDADVRRGVVTLQKKFGKRTAVICGDFLLSLALQTVSDVPRREDYLSVKLPDTIRRLCLGELTQHIHNGDLGLSAYRYLKIIEGKTAALFEASCYGGALTLTRDEKALRNYRRLGHYIGMIFQLTDDCNDFESSRELSKKPVQSDYEQGVVTLPLIYTLEREPSFREELAKGGVSRHEFNETVVRSGGLTAAHRLVRRYREKALRALDKLALPGAKRARLGDLLDKACRFPEAERGDA